MTDISDEIVEAVAKAIAKELYVDEQTSDDTESGTDYILARVALPACGYAQMRSALIDCKDYIDDPKGCTEHGMTATLVSLAAGAALRVKT